MYSVVLLMALTTGNEAVDRSKCGGGRHHKSCCGCTGYTSCGGCYGGGCSGYTTYGGCCGTVIMQGGEKKKEGKEGKEKNDEQIAAPATIVVSLPADAKLMVDGKATTSTSAVRTFVSPELTPGKSYYYTLKAEVVREGKPVVVEKRVDIAAGTKVNVSFEDMGTSLVSR